MNDLSDALNCIEEMKRCGTYGGQKIGRVVEEFTGQVMGYSAGEIILYTEELTPSDAELRMGEFRGMEQKPSGRVTIEKPLTPKQISGRIGRGHIRTMGTIVDVPLKYVEEIRV
ncbi:MAG TPA: hypothetical protein ENH99_01735 [Candidatus Pacearchaeota archaeon]|nr:hypothetical protein [Candidatus Pacearchaeota archaeon]